MTTKIILILILVSVFCSCKKETETNPQVETTTVKPVASYICYAKATIPEKGSYDMVDYGFVYSTYNGNFGIENNNTKVSLGTIPMVADTFSTSFSVGNGFGYSETFYVRAYYTNTKGTVYGSSLSFKPLVLSINSVQPNSGKAGDKITITGNNFSKKQTDNIVKFNNIIANVIEATSTKLVVEVPEGISTEYYNTNVPISITVGGITLNWSGFSLSPTITGFSPNSGTFGTIVRITGSNLYNTQVKLNNTQYYTNYNNNNSIQFNIPNDINTSKISISLIKDGVETVVPGVFTMDPCSITSVLPNKGLVGSQIVLSGTGFNPNSYNNSITIGDVKVTNYWSNNTNSVTMTVPESLKSGTYDVSINNGIDNAVLPGAFTVIEPKISGFSPKSGQYNSTVTISGENLTGLQYVAFGNASFGNASAEIISRNSDQIIVKVPSNLFPGDTKIWATVGNRTISSSEDFTVLSPEITSFSPSEGSPGTIITIKGSSLYSDRYNIGVKFGTIASSVINVSPTEIKAVVPSDAPSGIMKILIVTPWYTISTDTDFTVKK